MDRSLMTWSVHWMQLWLKHFSSICANKLQSQVPWRRAWQPTPVFLPGEFHGQRSMAGYSPWGHKELDTTEQLTLSHFRGRFGIELGCSVLIAQLCLTVCDPMDCSPPGSSVHGIHQARILEWVAMSSSRGSP